MRNLAAAFKRAINSRDGNGETIITLLQFDHETLATPIRLCNNRDGIVHDGDIFNAFGFNCVFPDDRADEITTAILTVDNTDRSILSAVRNLSKKLACAITVIMLSDPDTPHMGPMNYVIKNFGWDVQQLHLTLSVTFPFDEIFPGERCTPDKWRAAHRT